jgi:predicted transcriptional regulator
VKSARKVSRSEISQRLTTGRDPRQHAPLVRQALGEEADPQAEKEAGQEGQRQQQRGRQATHDEQRNPRPRAALFQRRPGPVDLPIPQQPAGSNLHQTATAHAGVLGYDPCP